MCQDRKHETEKSFSFWIMDVLKEPGLFATNLFQSMKAKSIMHPCTDAPLGVKIELNKSHLKVKSPHSEVPKGVSKCHYITYKLIPRHK